MESQRNRCNVTYRKYERERRKCMSTRQNQTKPVGNTNFKGMGKYVNEKFCKQLNQQKEVYYNEIDAIYTQLQDELIQMKNLCRYRIKNILQRQQIEDKIKQIEVAYIMANLNKLLVHFKIKVSEINEVGVESNSQQQVSNVNLYQNSKSLKIDLNKFSERMSKVLLDQ